MYTKLQRSIVKFITMMGLTVVIIGLLGLSPAQAADGESNNISSASDTTKSLDSGVSARTDTPSTISGDVADVLTANAGFVGKSKKVKACKAYAEKLEQQSPPRDPQAFCSGKVKVKLFGKIVASCPTGYLGAKMTLGVSLRQVVKARAFAKSVASGRVRTWARIKIRDLAKIKGKTHLECVLIPVITPPPPVEHDQCPNIPGNQPVGYECNPTPPPPTHDECPDIPGDQPKGYECSPPPPPAEKPLYAQFGEFNDLEVNWTDDHCVTVNFPAGHTGTVFWTAKFGSFAVSTKDAQDMVEVCSDYKAPSEVPAGGTDTITVTATDNVTGLSTVPQSTEPFVIHPTAGHPA